MYKLSFPGKLVRIALLKEAFQIMHCCLPCCYGHVMRRQDMTLLQNAALKSQHECACACAAGALAPGTAPAMMDELAGFTHCLDLSPGLMQMHWKARSLKLPSCKRMPYGLLYAYNTA